MCEEFMQAEMWGEGEERERDGGDCTRKLH